jgi:hypothetical protein
MRRNEAQAFASIDVDNAIEIFSAGKATAYSALCPSLIQRFMD